jgi:diguanylate cyclase (GGDEF)-like protein/PAS domain S-box-containing protein
LQHADLMLDRAETLVDVLVASQLRAQQCRNTVHNILQAAGLLLLIVIAALGRRQGVLPLREMVRLARRAGRGDYSGRLDYRADDEIGELASAFNDSNARTQQLIDELAARIAAAERAEAEANALLEAAADGILISAAEGRIVRVNREAERIFGYSRQELLERSVQDLVPDRFQSSHKNYWSSYMTAPVPRVMGRQAAVAGLRKSGSEIPLEISLSPARHGEQPSVIAVVRDVTERLRAEADHRRLLTILDTTPDMVAIFTPDHQLVYLNPAGRELLGIGPDDTLEGRSKDELLSPSARRLLREQALPTVLAAGVWSGELDLQDAHGREVPVSQLLIAHLDEQGQPTHVSAMARDISERRRHEAELLHQATHDQLTGLANRTLFNDRLKQAIYHAGRTGSLVALIFIDLDDFKQVNDSMGHAAGDLLLCEVARRLQKNLRKGDTRARFGGDEFAIILEGIAEPEDVTAIVENLAKKLCQPMSLAGREFVVTTSIGISLYPVDAASIDELLAHADTAMYRAKAEGRNSYRVYQPGMSELIELGDGASL